jgi:hypothetical protein
VADSLFTGSEVEFADGKKRFVKPLTIRQLRKFMKIVAKLDTSLSEIDDKQIDKMIEATQVALEKVDPKLAGDKDALEDAIDVVSFNAIFSIAMGNDPNV